MIFNNTSGLNFSSILKQMTKTYVEKKDKRVPLFSWNPQLTLYYLKRLVPISLPKPCLLREYSN